MENKEVIDVLKERFSDSILEESSPFGDDTVTIAKAALLDVMAFLKDLPQDFAMLLDLTCVDHQGDAERYEMVYHLFSLTHNLRLRIKTRIADTDLEIASLTGMWKNANWLEREVYDMFGIRFTDHPDMRRLFMYDGFEGHPLRKDYPLRKRQPCIPLRKGYDD